MNTYPVSPRSRTGRPGRAAALAACLLIVTLLLTAGAGWSTQAAPAAQEPPPSRLAYDGPFDRIAFCKSASSTSSMKLTVP